MVSPDDLAAFERDGYVVVPGVFRADELAAYSRAVTAAVRHRSAGGLPPLEARSRYRQSFVQCMNLWEDHPDVRPLTFDPRVGRRTHVRTLRAAVAARTIAVGS